MKSCLFLFLLLYNNKLLLGIYFPEELKGKNSAEVVVK